MKLRAIVTALLLVLAIAAPVQASSWVSSTKSWTSHDDQNLWSVRVVVNYDYRISSDGPPWIRNIAPTCWVASSFIYKVTIKQCAVNIPTQRYWWTSAGVQQKVGVRYQVCVTTAGFFDLYCTTITSYIVISGGRCMDSLGRTYGCKVVNGPYTEVL